jgi:ABC-2 type transport system ATP-binding protein
LIASLGGEHVIQFTLACAPTESIDAALAALPSVSEVRQEDSTWSLSVAEPHIVLPLLMEKLRERHCELTSLTTRHASLEDVFVKLAGRHLDDEPVHA